MDAIEKFWASIFVSRRLAHIAAMFTFPGLDQMG
jgi:hypothetical protein